MKEIFRNKFFAFMLFIIYFETIFKIFCFNNLLNISWLYIFVFSIPIVFSLFLLTKLFKERINKILNILFIIAITLTYETHLIFYKLFSTILSLTSLGMTDQAVDNTPIVFEAIWKNIIPFSLLLLPLIISIIFNKKLNNSKINTKKGLILIILNIILYFATLLILLLNRNSIYSPYNLYFKVHEPNLTVDRIGLATAIKLDIKRYIFGFESNVIVNKEKTNKDKKDKEDIKYNISNIDFTSLASKESNSTINSMHEYFNNVTPTKQNKYTGLFKGKNLIFILAEGFNSLAVDKDLTPTMYKLTHEGFIFDNFYSPVFLSTTGGEFQSMTGLIPNQTILNSWKVGKVSFPYAIGNTLSKEGYLSKAFHNWSYKYYSRNVTMTTLGFKDFFACGNGLQKLMNCNIWPPSDIEMFNVTPQYYINSEIPFVIDYITVSGHARYSFSGNNMATKNKSLVQNLPYSESIKAYLATQIELDRGLKVLLDTLEESNKLKDTVIVMVGDHYPYSLTVDEINEKSEFTRDGLFEVNRSNLILWNSELKEVKIDKVGGSIDILPTLLNLFGIEYDSRLIIGKDLLSDTDGLVMFSNRSWVSDYGRYNASTKEFTTSTKKKLSIDYVDTINNKVYNNFSMSELIVQKNYYNLIFNK